MKTEDVLVSILSELKRMDRGPSEEGHMEKDRLLVEAFRVVAEAFAFGELGRDIVAEYEAIDAWYA